MCTLLREKSIENAVILHSATVNYVLVYTAFHVSSQNHDCYTVEYLKINNDKK